VGGNKKNEVLRTVIDGFKIFIIILSLVEAEELRGGGNGTGKSLVGVIRVIFLPGKGLHQKTNRSV